MILTQLGMSAPILEGIIEDDPLHHIPTYAKERPNVEFEPKNNGIFG
jgi:L-ascorbate oxidase